MDLNEKRQQIESVHYWDARVVKLTCDYFADEVKLEFQDDPSNICIHFTGCYKVLFDHSRGYIKDLPSRVLSTPQVPYFLQDIEINEVNEGSLSLYSCKISMPPMLLEIWCSDISIVRNPSFPFANSKHDGRG
jgi:hypothetical protein